jgi:peptidase E
MKLFLTSSLNNYKKIDGQKVVNEIDNQNGIVDQLKEALTRTTAIAFVPSNPNDLAKTNENSTIVVESLKLSGINFDHYYIVDKSNVKEAVQNSDMIFLMGGDTQLQNEFFKAINLKHLLKDYDGVIVGVSAGSINAAGDVYSSPEGEIDLGKETHLEGLGLTNLNLEVHFTLDDKMFSNDELIQRKAILEESMSRELYAICDGTHVLSSNGDEIIYGEAYRISDGVITKICDNKQHFKLPTKDIKEGYTINK